LAMYLSIMALSPDCAAALIPDRPEMRTINRNVGKVFIASFLLKTVGATRSNYKTGAKARTPRVSRLTAPQARYSIATAVKLTGGLLPSFTVPATRVIKMNIRTIRD